MPVSIQEAQQIATAVAAEFECPPPPDIYVSTQLSKLYAGAYFDKRKAHGDNPDAQHIIIRPEYFSVRTIAHECGHYIYHYRNPGVCQGGSRDCEEVAQMIEAYWMDKLEQSGIPYEDWK